jgi:hypothetical protein
MLAKALAKESGAAFINITAASMQSKWHATEGHLLALSVGSHPLSCNSYAACLSAARHSAVRTLAAGMAKRPG